MASGIKTKASDDVDGYVLAAAVLDAFDPDRLKPLSAYTADHKNLFALAFVSQTHDDQFEWRLPDEIRRSALLSMGNVNALRYAIDLNREARFESSYQRVFDGYISGAPPPLETQTLEELQATLQTISLLEGLDIDLPDQSTVHKMVLRASYLREFEVFADKHFIGRDAELKRLERFVDVLPDGLYSSVRRATYAYLSERLKIAGVLHEKPLLIVGIGGMGKSSLISKFLLNHLRNTVSHRLVFTYLDFDKMSIWPDQPLTLLAEICHQFTFQSHDQCKQFEELERHIRGELAHSQSHRASYDSNESIRNTSLHSRRHSRYLNEFQRICEKAFENIPGLTFLLILDTFEEVIQRSSVQTWLIWDFLNELQEVMPRLRVVISSRANPFGDGGFERELSDLHSEGNYEIINLGDLSKRDATDLLEVLSSANRHTCESVVRRIGGHPLSIRLAAQLIRTVASSHNVHPREVEPYQLINSSWDEHIREGFLYRRIIAHIDDEKLRLLADPGFVLRELTPDLIYEVLNEPCRLEIMSREEAEEIFQRCRSLYSLVTMHADGRLRYRTELRSRILPQIIQAAPHVCHDIWQRAIVYYERQGVPSAEALYCRLMLNQSEQELAKHWQPGIEKRLANARAELPPSARRYLELKIRLQDVAIPDEPFESSEPADTHLRDEIARLLEWGYYKKALALMNGMEKKTPSSFNPFLPLFLRALAQDGRHLEAWNGAIAYIQNIENLGRAGARLYLELLLLACQIALSEVTHKRRESNNTVFGIFSLFNTRDSTPKARILWKHFNQMVRRAGDDVMLLRIAVSLLQLVEEEQAPVVSDTSRIARVCAARARKLLHSEKIKLDAIGGEELLRAFAWLYHYSPSDARVCALLDNPTVLSVLKSEYAPLLPIEIQHASREFDETVSMSNLINFLNALDDIRDAQDGLLKMTTTEVSMLAQALRNIMRSASFIIDQS